MAHTAPPPGVSAQTKLARLFGLEGEMYFGAGMSLEAHLEAIEARLTPRTQVVVLRLKRARNPDAVGLVAHQVVRALLRCRPFCRLVVFGPPTEDRAVVGWATVRW